MNVSGSYNNRNVAMFGDMRLGEFFHMLQSNSILNQRYLGIIDALYEDNLLVFRAFRVDPMQ